MKNQWIIFLFESLAMAKLNVLAKVKFTNFGWLPIREAKTGEMMACSGLPEAVTNVALNQMSAGAH